MRGGRRSAALVLTALATASCAPGEVEPLRAPPTTRPLASTTTTAPADYRAVRLEGVSGGRSRTAVTLGPGQARLVGTVVGPGGPVPGAVVHVERLVGDAAATAGVATGPDGAWMLAGVLGGRYRVRAWRSPDLAMLSPELFFMEATEGRNVTLVVTPATGTSTASDIAPDPPVVGQGANVVVRISRRLVDERGIVRTVPLARAPVVLEGLGQWTAVSPNPAITDGSGSVQWTVVCLVAGPSSLTVTAGAEQLPLTLPPCVG